MEPPVALFVTNFLPGSATFVHDEIRHHERYPIEVFARSRRNPDLFPFEPVHVGGRRYGLTGSTPAFEQLLRKRRYSLLHAHFGWSAVLAAGLARRHRLPLVVTFHGRDVSLLHRFPYRDPSMWRYAAIARRGLREITLGLCVSQEMLDLVAAAGIDRDRLRVHRLGVDSRRFAPDRAREDASAMRVAMIGRLIDKKGFDDGLRAFARATGIDAAAQLEVIGDGPERGRLQRLAARLGIAERVRFTGWLPADEVAARLRGSDVLLAPSRIARDGDREGTPMTLKEAAASGAVVVATLHGGVAEVIDDNVSGFLVPERDVAGLARCLHRLIVNPGLLRRMAEAARGKIVRDYDLRQVNRQLEHRYDEARRLFADAAR